MLKKNYLLILVLIFSTSKIFGQSATSLNFDGIDDYITTAAVPGVISTATTQQFTIEFWVKPAAATKAKNWLFYSQPSVNELVNAFMASDRKLYFRIGLNSSKRSNVALPLNTWSHVAFVMPGSYTNSKIYINGVDASDTGFINVTPVYGATGIFSIGANPAGGDGFSGTMDEFRIWNVAKTPAEVASTMGNELALPQSNLSVYYKFNQGVANGINSSVTTLIDELNVINGTLHNFALAGTTSNWIGESALSIENFENSTNEFKIFPNPVRDILNYEGKSIPNSYQIYSVEGKLIQNEELRKSAGTINLSKLKKGNYLIVIFTNTETFTRKIIKK